MKIKTQFFALFVLFVLFVSLAGFSQEQKKRVEVETNYFGGGLKTTFDYPMEPGGNVSGKKHEITGLDGSVKIAVNDTVRVGLRGQVNTLRRVRYYSSYPGDTGSADTGQSSAVSRYWETFGLVELPKIKQSLILGLAHWQFDRTWKYKFSMPDNPSQVNVNNLDVSALGPVVGLAGEKKIGKLTLQYEGRGFPRMARSDKNYGQSGKSAYANLDIKATASGFELRGTAAYLLARNLSLVGGYQYRRLYTPDPTSSRDWTSNETEVEKGFLLGLRFTF